MDGGNNKQRNSSSSLKKDDLILVGAVVIFQNQFLKTLLPYVYLPGVYFLKVTKRFTRILISS